MEFASPYLFLLAALALPVGFLAWRRRRSAYAISSAHGLMSARPTLRLRAARLLPLLRIAAVVLLAAGIARPRLGDANAVVPGEGVDIVLSLDISSSMSTRFDGQRSRLEVVKEVITNFIKGRENDRVGLVVFQRDALALAPPTLDYRALETMVATLDSNLLPDGTGIGIGLAEAVNVLRDSGAASRVVILLTDGEHNAQSIKPLDAAEIAAALHIRVYTIGVVEKSRGVDVGVDARLLTEMAARTGGKYFAADNPKALSAVYDEIGRLETSKVGRERFESFTELAPWLIGGAALLLMLELALRGTVLRRAPA